MWSNALCTLGVTKPLCNCLSIRQVAAAAAAAASQGAAITTGPTSSSTLSGDSHGKRPLKIWDSRRNVRKSLVVGSFEELLTRGKNKLGVPASEPVRVVLESDGTQVEDGDYFRTLANNTVLLLLRQGERWYPTGVDVIKAGDDSDGPQDPHKQLLALLLQLLQIPQAQSHPQPQPSCSCSSSSTGAQDSVPGASGSVPHRSPGPKGLHVRFLNVPDAESDSSDSASLSESEEATPTDTFLLLTDDERRLKIKDIGIILAGLDSSIVDVDYLCRDLDSDDCYNWTIKATVCAKSLFHRNVVYRDKEYQITEHPGYKVAVNETGEDEEQDSISAIPKIVCETIHALELHDETPSWKIMDNKGRVTVVLHWDQRHGGGGGGSGERGGASSSGAGGGNGLMPSDKYSPSKKGLSAQSSLDNKSVSSSQASSSSHQQQQQRYAHLSPQITVISDDGGLQSTSGGGLYRGSGVAVLPPGIVIPGTSRRLSKQISGSAGGGSFDSAVGAVHVHTPECAHRAHTPSRAGSPSGAECDFHCCALHEEGRPICAVHNKSVATSPIQDGTSSPQSSHHQQQLQQQHAANTHAMLQMSLSSSSSLMGSGGIDPMMMGASTSSSRRSSGAKGQHVRFLDAPDRDSSESETENTVMEDDKTTTEKFLLLTDQLSVDQKRHLSIKDIGIILERLNSKILDVERLDRESDSDDCYNWTIKATIRGDTLRELGVIYNGNYYAISEHPGYKEEVEEIGDEIEEEDDDEEEEIEDRRL